MMFAAEGTTFDPAFWIQYGVLGVVLYLLFVGKVLRFGREVTREETAAKAQKVEHERVDAIRVQRIEQLEKLLAAAEKKNSDKEEFIQKMLVEHATERLDTMIKLLETQARLDTRGGKNGP